MARADRFTIETEKVERFSDFLTNLDKNPVTGFVAKATNSQAIEQSMRNLLLTNQGDWPFESTVGSKVRSSMFELNDPRIQDEIKASIAETIHNHEPRVELIEVTLTTDPNTYTAYINVKYSILSIADSVFDFSIAVNRVR